jgi:hypothetical protein
MREAPSEFRRKQELGIVRNFPQPQTGDLRTQGLIERRVDLDRIEVSG